MAITRLIVDVEMIDGTIHEGIVTVLADQMRYTKARKTFGWDGPQEDPLTFQNFSAFAALNRLGLFTGDWTAFTHECAGVEGRSSGAVDPTTAGQSAV